MTALSRRVRELRNMIPDYTIWGRASRTQPSIDKAIGDYGDGVVLVVGSSGLNVSNRGGWVGEMYGAKMRWRKGL